MTGIARTGRLRWGLAAAAVTLAATAAAPAAAQTCAAEVERFASAQDLSPTLPPRGGSGSSGLAPQTDGADGSAGGTIGPEALNRSGGVIQPPGTGDPAVIPPPPGAGSAMPTMPGVRPAPSDGGSGSSDSVTGDTHGRAARRAQMEAAVTAARAAAARGDEQGCMQGLASAERLAAGAGDTGQGGRP